MDAVGVSARFELISVSCSERLIVISDSPDDAARIPGREDCELSRIAAGFPRRAGQSMSPRHNEDTRSRC